MASAMDIRFGLLNLLKINMNSAKKITPEEETKH